MFYISEYFNASGLNPILYNTVCGKLNKSITVMGGAYRTDWKLHTMGLQDIDMLVHWIYALIPEAAYHLGGGAGGEDYSGCGFDNKAFRISECWGIHYNKGEYVFKHNHFPFALSFCYCVTAPEGSSPFIVEDEEIEPLPGRIVFFHAHKYHNTLPNKSDGRCMIAGNISYDPEYHLEW
jgi:hypothetical protein